MSGYDAVVVGGTPGGIAAAVRSAREGQETLLVTYNEHLGGMMAGGLSYTDTLTAKTRAPLLEEFVGAVREHYSSTYGPDSEQVEFCENGYVFEPHVAERIFDTLVDAEDALTVWWGYHPASVERAGRTVRRVTFEPFDGGDARQATAEVFVEATYEGDLAAVAGVPYRIGRESSAEYDEQFAGKLFTRARGDRYYPREAVGNDDRSVPPDRRGPLDVPAEKRQGALDLVPHPAGLTEILPKSTGEGDDAIQAYNYRLCLSRDPDNRRRPEKPDGYDRSDYLEALEDVEESGLRSHLLLRYLPNDKADMNAADLPGANHDYPEADWDRRAEIARRHRDHALGLLYFLQNDDAVPEGVREAAWEWGLARDEFSDTDNFPWQLYVREARRIRGRCTFTENDARHAPGLDRAPVHGDAIAIAEYPLDSHACTTERQPGSQPEGFFYASQVTRPSQVPYRALLPRGVDNLLVPVPLSATHCGYGTIRVEPTWLHIGEAAGVATSLAADSGTSPADLDVDRLQRALLERGVMVSFFNEFDVADDEPWVEAVQYLGTKGFFGSYDARPEATLSGATADSWATLTSRWLVGETDEPTAAARSLPDDSNEAITGGEFAERLAARTDRDDVGAVDDIGVARDEPISRGDACRVIYRLLDSAGE